jgi:hypothetical protein
MPTPGSFTRVRRHRTSFAPEAAPTERNERDRIQAKRRKINEPDRYPPAHNGLVAGRTLPGRLLAHECSCSFVGTVGAGLRSHRRHQTDLHATFSDSTAKRLLNFRLHARGYMLRTWIEMISASVTLFAVASPSSSELSIGSAASSSETFDRASQKSQIALAVDSG